MKVIKGNLIMFDFELKYTVLTTLFKVLLPIITLLVCAGLFFVLPHKSKKATKITKLVVGFSLIAFYLAKTIFLICKYIKFFSFNISYVANIFGLDINFYLMALTSFVLIYTAFSNKQSFVLDICKNTMAGIALPLAFLSLCNPKLIVSVSNPWYHVTNLASILINCILILAPVYLIKLKEIKVSLRSYWQAISGYVLILCMCMTTNIILKSANISELSYSSTLNNIFGTQINFPWHLLIVIPVFLLLAFGIYAIERAVISIVTKQKFIEDIEIRNKSEFFDIYTFATKTICCMQGVLLLIIIATLVKNPKVNSWLGLVCLIPLVMTIFCLLTIYEMQKYIENTDQTIFNKGDKRARKIITYAYVGNCIFGFALSSQFRNERDSIEEYNERQARKQALEEKQNTDETDDEDYDDDYDDEEYDDEE